MINIRIIDSTPPCIRNKMMEQRANDVAQKYPGKVVVTRIAALSKEESTRQHLSRWSW